ncbi:MAG TPA: NAD(+) synthase [Myxococcales bacterium]|nr:NAD(+) synthase [Myxococcales bacterium]
MFGRQVLELDAAVEIARIEAAIRVQVFETLHRRGAVLGLSGGVDSSVVAALCARALGADRVLGLLMPDRDSSSDALRLGTLAAEQLGLETLVESIGPVAEAAGCYERQAAAIRTVFPEFGPGWRCKLTLPGPLAGERLPISLLTVEDPLGARRCERLSGEAYRALVAATNYKQRLRKTAEYYHADRLNRAVAGTANRLEHELGFFVKQGDGAADLKPIAHLYKTQVYALAEALGVPEEIRSRTPTTDTFSLPQTQEEFYFAVPHATLDQCLYALDHGVPAAEVAAAVGLTEAQVGRVFLDLQAKRRAARYLHEPPLGIASGAAPATRSA